MVEEEDLVVDEVVDEEEELEVDEVPGTVRVDDDIEVDGAELGEDEEFFVKNNMDGLKSASNLPNLLYLDCLCFSGAWLTSRSMRPHV